MTDPTSIDDALAAGWPIVTVDDVTARPLETRDPHAELRSRYVGQNVVATIITSGQRVMAVVVGSSRSDWTRPREGESPSSTQHTHD